MNLCPKCGSVIAADAVARQCPRCLIRIALADDENPSNDGARRQFGDYQLGRQIGAGGMGAVYEAQRLNDGETVAIKLIRDFYVTSATSLRRFTIEAEAAARLEHANIVRIHEVGDSDGHPFLSMDFIEGESLQARIGKTDFTTDQRELARFMAKVARAVHHAHTRGVIHRDLKPGNILIDSKGEPHLTDFGLAKLLQPSDETCPRTLTASGDVPGTPSYMSPEQASGSEVTPASDIYGLGAVLYALLTGRPPFEGPTPLDVFHQIVNQLPKRPRSIDASIHADLQTICLKCLEKNPPQRYGSAEGLAQDLESFAAARPISARQVTLLHRTNQWVRRNPVGAGLIASLCIGLSVALLLLKIVSDQRREIQLDRDLAFDDGMQKISQIWRDPATKSVTISARELGILAGRSPSDLRGARPFTFGVSADDGPSSMAQRYARVLGSFREHIQRELGEKIVFHLCLLKRFNQDEETLIRGEVDFIVLSAIDFLQAQRMAPEIQAIARANTSREAVIFARTNSGIERLSDLRGKSVAFPDPGEPLSVWAKARLFDAGIRSKDLRLCTNIVDRGPETGATVISSSATLELLLRGEADAGVSHRSQFERYRHLGLVMLDRFPDTPKVLAARTGLDARFADALRNVIGSPESSKSWPDAKFVSDSQTIPLLQELRIALQKAEDFDKPSEVTHH